MSKITKNSERAKNPSERKRREKAKSGEEEGVAELKRRSRLNENDKCVFH